MPKLKVNIKKLKRLYIDRNMTIAGTAKALGISSTAVLRRLDSEGVPRHRTAVDATELQRLYVDKQMTLQKVGDHFGVTRQAVHSRLIAMGIKPRPRGGGRRPFDRETLFQSYVVEGLSQDEIHKKYGVSENFIVQELKRLGIEHRNRGGKKVPQFPRDLIYQLYIVDGLTLKQVGARLGVGAKIISRELMRHGINHRHTSLEPPRFERELLIKLYETEGLSIEAVAKVLNVSRGVISYAVKRHGIKSHPRGSVRKRTI